MSFKFSRGQKIVVPNFMINGNRMDIGAEVERYVINSDTKIWRVEVLLNDTRVILDENRLIDYNEYWEKEQKNAGKE